MAIDNGRPGPDQERKEVKGSILLSHCAHTLYFNRDRYQELRTSWDAKVAEDTYCQDQKHRIGKEGKTMVVMVIDDFFF
jgi:hypothetical protein